MWVSIHLEVHQVWDELLWSVRAIWREDEASESVILVRSGRASCYGLQRPEQILRAAVSALTAEQTRERAQHRTD